uniref:NADH-ubiquinone oxidoreductase chain 6 n=1 Tax=Platanista gangetica TaxID=118798 RepID=A0A7R6MDQ9_PLAGN|nr:NADH dehydrogenase subunit 6 [Platanista gangetica]AYA51925.1 NADH dehydrogenase subunit 6 [Platanista gangetica]QRH19136.1 NADH dehydrogenase subunit 6 [Platanista gangetica]QRH19149.1 NADH dehydrogenase subunit 6 [Platanista gangetica]QRH19162.1 NADH dehydrogenase subunit 6 [Platanista gangetica]QRH19175.1 NADH dehydrogenase subunit 6 [Platanista gangetica]
MAMYIVFIMSIVFVISIIGVSSKPSPVYGGLGLVVGGGVGCGIILNSGGSFLGLLVFLVYLGGMLVVFGYTTAMATDQYPEVWASSKVVLGAFLLGLVVEFLVVLYVLGGGEGEFMFDGLGGWVGCGVGDSGVISGEVMGIAAFYSYGAWLVVVTGWSLFMGVVVIMEITRGS